MSTRWAVFFIKFLLLGAFFIISNHNLALANMDDRTQFVTEYGSWIKSVADNVGSLTGYVIKVEWLPGVEDQSLNELTDPKG